MVNDIPILPIKTDQPLLFEHKEFIGAVKDEWSLYSNLPSDYTIGLPIGFGASSIVYTAHYQPPRSRPSAPLPATIPCALKVLDLDSLPPRSLQLLKRETTLMSLSKHPNVLRVRGSWMQGHQLCIALRLMNKGSAADVMRYGWPNGMEEDVIRCILAQALKGLNYLHINGFIHRDVKAANLLIDDDGTVLLGDLGVAADLTEDTSYVKSNIHPFVKEHSLVSFDSVVPKPSIGKRKSFVGTPCWMSPELIQGRHYDSSADIWSFGITALELTQGRPPRSRESPQSVLLRTIQDGPPTLDREGGVHKYSRAFKEMVDSCLVKDPSKRPTAEQLLQTPFFKAAKKKSYLVNAILKDLPPLTQRQERRVMKSPQTIHTLDSWNFTTVNSPFNANATTSVYRHNALQEMVTDAVANQRIDGVFEMEGDIDTTHQTHLSWEDPVPLARDESKEDELLSATPDSTNSVLRSSPSASLGISPPSSFAESPPRSLKQADGTPSPLTHGNGVKPGKSLRSSSGPGHNIWLKLKNNLKRPSSKSGLPGGDIPI